MARGLKAEQAKQSFSGASRRTSVLFYRSLVSRKGGLLAKLLGRPWPNDEEVLTAVREAVRKAGRNG